MDKRGRPLPCRDYREVSRIRDARDRTNLASAHIYQLPPYSVTLDKELRGRYALYLCVDGQIHYTFVHGSFNRCLAYSEAFVLSRGRTMR